jgi:hypothetical protein
LNETRKEKILMNKNKISILFLNGKFLVKLNNINFFIQNVFKCNTNLRMFPKIYTFFYIIKVLRRFGFLSTKIKNGNVNNWFKSKK